MTRNQMIKTIKSRWSIADVNLRDLPSHQLRKLVKLSETQKLHRFEDFESIRSEELLEIEKILCPKSDDAIPQSLCRTIKLNIPKTGDCDCIFCKHF